MLNFDRLNEVLYYDLSVNHFRWKIKPNWSIKIGAIAGCLHSNGRWIIKIDGKNHFEHRLIWLYHTGVWPKKHIDHINGNPSDNRLENLREATRSQNLLNRGVQKNNKSTGHKNICPNNSGYKVECRLDRKLHYLGTFRTVEEAIVVRDEWCRKHHGEFLHTTHTQNLRT